MPTLEEERENKEREIKILEDNAQKLQEISQHNQGKENYQKTIKENKVKISELETKLSKVPEEIKQDQETPILVAISNKIESLTTQKKDIQPLEKNKSDLSTKLDGYRNERQKYIDKIKIELPSKLDSLSADMSKLNLDEMEWYKDKYLKNLIKNLKQDINKISNDGNFSSLIKQKDEIEKKITVDRASLMQHQASNKAAGTIYPLRDYRDSIQKIRNSIDPKTISNSTEFSVQDEKEIEEQIILKNQELSKQQKALQTKIADQNNSLTEKQNLLEALEKALAAQIISLSATKNKKEQKQQSAGTEISNRIVEANEEIESLKKTLKTLEEKRLQILSEEEHLALFPGLWEGYKKALREKQKAETEKSTTNSIISILNKFHKTLDESLGSHYKSNATTELTENIKATEQELQKTTQELSQAKQANASLEKEKESLEKVKLSFNEDDTINTIQTAIDQHKEVNDSNNKEIQTIDNRIKEYPQILTTSQEDLHKEIEGKRKELQNLIEQHKKTIEKNSTVQKIHATLEDYNNSTNAIEKVQHLSSLVEYSLDDNKQDAYNQALQGKEIKNLVESLKEDNMPKEILRSKRLKEEEEFLKNYTDDKKKIQAKLFYNIVEKAVKQDNPLTHTIKSSAVVSAVSAMQTNPAAIALILVSKLALTIEQKYMESKLCEDDIKTLKDITTQLKSTRQSNDQYHTKQQSTQTKDKAGQLKS